MLLIDVNVRSKGIANMNVVYKSAGKYRKLRGTRAGTICIRVALLGVAYTAVVGGFMFLITPHQYIKPSQKPLEFKSTKFSKSLEKAVGFHPSTDGKSI